MEVSKTDKPIDELDLHRAMRDLQARHGHLVPSNARVEKINALLFHLRQLPEHDFENCMAFFETFIEKRTRSNAMKKNKEKSRTETSKEASAIFGGTPLKAG